MVGCPWCKYNPGCGDPMVECDFKSLPYEKDAIIKRLIKEREWIDTVKMQMLDGVYGKSDAEEVMAGVVDRSKGMQIMVGRLVVDFGMDEEEVKKAAGFKKDSFLVRAQLAAKVAQMRKSRGKSKHSVRGG